MLIRLLALLGLLWTGKQVVKHASSLFHPDQSVKDPQSGGEISDEVVKDPVCQTYIPRSIAIQKTIEGKVYYFCSEECAAKFSKQQQST